MSAGGHLIAIQIRKKNSASGAELMTIRPGFTGHVGMDDVQLIHMRGRVYDPVIGRFLSPDPYVQYAGDTEGLNPEELAVGNETAGAAEGVTSLNARRSRRGPCVYTERASIRLVETRHAR